MNATLHRSARRFDMLFADSERFLAILSTNGRLERVGARVLEAFGAMLEEALGRAFEDAPWWSDCPDVRARLRDAVERAVRDSPARVVMPLIATGGEWREVDLSISRVGDGAPGAFLLVIGEDVVSRQHEREASPHRVLAEALNEERRQRHVLLATLAHEMRNPLAPIRSALDLLHEADDADEREALRLMMVRHIEHVAHLVEDLFDLSRLDGDQIVLHEDTIEADALVRDALSLTPALTETHRHAVTKTLPAPAILLRVDPTRMAQVLSNLLGNAARHTPENGHIDVRLELEDKRVRIVVADDGRGLDAASRERIFETFVQLPDEHGKAPDGLGLGLTLARRFVELHGGTLEVESAGIGRGSTFTVSLPIARVAAAKTLPIETVSPVAKSHGARQRRPDVLVVDDNRDAADTLAKLLRLKGFDIITAYTGLATLEQVAQTRFDAIVLDIGLPDISGHEVAERLRAGGIRTRLVALTGWGTAEDVAKSLAVGFDHHLTKPVTMQRLLEALDDVAQAERATDGA